MSDTIKNWGGKLLDWLGIANVPAPLKALEGLKGEAGQIIKIGGVDAQGGVTELVAVDKPEGDDDPGQNVPQVTEADVGKFLRVSADGAWAAEALTNVAEVGA